MTPRATLRLQFHREFTFADAEGLTDWIAGLGISHVYASPVTAARAGSMHGYDVIDPTIVNPELGGEEALKSLAVALKAKGVGLVLDIVPNHMAADYSNGWWRDVLQRGRASRYAHWFDVDWTTGDGKILLPVLGRPIEEAIEAGEITLESDDNGRPALSYFTHRFPLADGSVEGRGSIANLLARQHYRLASWRVAGDQINWRRFFDINELVCLRMEEPETFDAAHALPLRLFAEGMIDGLRIDHVDGLTNPAAYCRTLRSRLDALAETTGRSRGWLVIEKILLRDEALSSEWGVDGTTGYDFMNEVNALQHDPDGEALLSDSWAAISRRPSDFAKEEEPARREIVARSFSAQLEACASAWKGVLDDAVPVAALRRVLTEFLAHFPVYRTYAAEGSLPGDDAAILQEVARKARLSCLATDRWVVDALLQAMLQPPSREPKGWQRAMARFQQLCAPIAAKSVEDTGFYRYGRLLSRNDVGFDMECFSLAPTEFHERMQERSRSWPQAMLTTATHDHKRGEDVRARLAVLSERAGPWVAQMPRWLEALEPLRTETAAGLAPTHGDMAMLVQMIVGAWPMDLALDDDDGRRQLAERLAGWQEKALREAKLRSDWADPDAVYEDAARNLLMRLVAANDTPDLLREIFAWVQAIAPAGAVNGLAQALLRTTVPGVPDLYQGTDLWDFSLVDPDNRRPVDYGLRALRPEPDLPSLAAEWRDGRIKQHVIRQALELRRAAPSLFLQGDYRPIAVEGAGSRSILAFSRQSGQKWMVVMVPRLISGQLAESGLSLAPDTWRDTELVVGDTLTRLPLYDWLGHGIAEPLQARVRAGFLCGTLPLALLATVAPPSLRQRSN